MSKFPIISLIIAIVAMVAAANISRSMNHMRTEMYKEMPERVTRVYTPVMGMDKFCADVSWIKLIQKMGDPNVKMKYDEQGKTAAAYFYKQLDWITTLDPDANKVYRIGSRHISHLQPEQAIDLLNKGNSLSSKADWKRFHLCSFIEDRYIADRIKGDSEEDKNKRNSSLKASSEYLKQAMDMTDTPSYIETAWLRKQAELGGYRDDPLQFLKAEAEYFFKRRKDLSIEGADSESYSIGDDSRLTKIKDRIQQKAQTQAVERWNAAQTASKAGKAAEAATQMKIHADILKLYKRVMPELKHYSPVSLANYAPGDFFDVVTGTKVKPYGLSYKAYMDNKQIVVLKGQYCQLTGMSRAESDAKWAEWSKAQGIK